MKPRQPAFFPGRSAEPMKEPGQQPFQQLLEAEATRFAQEAQERSFASYPFEYAYAYAPEPMPEVK